MYMLCRRLNASMYVVDYAFFFFKQKTAYEMRISDWSSDVSSSDLQVVGEVDDLEPHRRQPRAPGGGDRAPDLVGVVVDAVVRHRLPVPAQRVREQSQAAAQEIGRAHV